MQAEAGKGSRPRHTQNQAAYAEAWERIFGHGKEKSEADPNSGEQTKEPDGSANAQAQVGKAQ